MKTKHLTNFLQQLNTFDRPKLQLEQYATPVELAVPILEQIKGEVDLSECLVCDLGCGCGILLLGISLLGSSESIGVDIDQDALGICQSNAADLGLENSVELIAADVTAAYLPFREKFDVVVSNPPFGTKNNAGIDWKFVKAGMSILRPGGRMYSLHKSASRKLLLRKSKEWNNVIQEGEVVAQLNWNLNKTYSHHRKGSVDISVDLFRFIKC